MFCINNYVMLDSRKVNDKTGQHTSGAWEIHVKYVWVVQEPINKKEKWVYDKWNAFI